MAGEARSVLLRSWPERPLQLANFHRAALSPAQDVLLLLSRSGSVVPLLLGVGLPSANEVTSSVSATALPLPDHVRSFAWAQCDTGAESESEQLVFTAATDSLRIYALHGRNSNGACSDESAGQPEEAGDGADGSSAGEPGSGGVGSGEGTRFPVAEARLEDCDDGLCFYFHRSSPGQIASTCFPSSSTQFSRLIELGLKHRSSRSDDTGPSGRAAGGAGYGILEVLSSPSHKFVALIFGKEEQAEQKQGDQELEDNDSGILDEKSAWHQDSVKTTRRFAGSDAFVVLADVQSWGIRFLACKNHLTPETEVAQNDWVDFALSRDILVGLEGRGRVVFWEASSGEVLASMDVRDPCQQLHFEDDFSVTHGRKKYRLGKKVVWTGFSRKRLWMDGAEELLKTNKSSEVREGASQVARRSTTVISYRFENVTVTPDCRFLAARADHGLIFLVSLDDHLASESSNWRHPSSHEPCHSSTLAVASFDIGRSTPARCALQPWWIQRSADRESVVAAAGDSAPTGSSSWTSGSLQGLKWRRRLVFCSNHGNQLVREMVLSPFELVTMFSSSNQTGDLGIVQNRLDIASGAVDDISVTQKSGIGMLDVKEQMSFQNPLLPFSFRGCPYFVTPTGLHVVLPPVAMDSGESVLTRETVSGQWWPTGAKLQDLIKCGRYLEPSKYAGTMQKWQAGVLDRALVYDGLTETEKFCVQNGWSLSLLRLRRLELGLSFLQILEIEQALESMMDASSAEVGVPRELFSAIELMISGFKGDKDLARSSRLLALAALLATRLIHRQWLLRLRCQQEMVTSVVAPEATQLSSDLSELAGFLEFVRDMQDRLRMRNREPSQGLNGHGNRGGLGAVDEQPTSKVATRSNGETRLEIMDRSPADPLIYDHTGVILPSFASSPGPLSSHSILQKRLELVPDSGQGQPVDGLSFLSADIRGDCHIVAVENSGDMLSRWEKEKLDATAVVRDALQAGRLPLAIVQLQAFYAKQNRQLDSEDVFREVQDIGRNIVYRLMSQGKIEEATATLGTLGEDLENALRELAFGTTSRKLRNLASAELQKHGWLGAFEAELLEKIHHLEGVYPISNFWNAYNTRRKYLEKTGTVVGLQDGERLGLTVGGHRIECGEVNEVVIGSWSVEGSEEDKPSTLGDQDNPLAGYFSAAAIWLFQWDKATFDRVLLDQPGIIGYSASWETKLTYYVARHDWREVSSLLDDIPCSVLQSGQLLITSNLDRNAFELVIPEVQILSMSSETRFSIWLRQMVEDKLLSKGIFLQSVWKGTTELVALLARGGRLFSHCGDSVPEAGSSDPSVSGPVNEAELHPRTIKAIQQLMVLHCVENSLPQTLALHVDQQLLNQDEEFATGMLAVAGGCHWATWMLLFFMKGCEYNASIENAKAMVVSGSKDFNCRQVEDVDFIFRSFDDLCEAAGEEVALANLVYTPLPLKTYLWSGLQKNSFSLPSNISSQRRMTKFPTLWKHLTEFSGGASHVPELSFDGAASATNLNEYLLWRRGLFSSSCNDISLLGMLPPSFPKDVRRLIQLSTEPDPEGLQKLEASADFTHIEDGPTRWEALIQASIEEELYVKDSEESESKVLYLLRRGRGVAAFEYLLNIRLANLGSQEPESSAVLFALTSSEQKLVSPAVLLAVRQYYNSRVVAACVCFLELCGVSSSVLRIIVQSLQRIYQHLEVNSREQEGTEASESGRDVVHMESLVEDYIAEVMNTDDLHLLVGKASSHRIRRAAFAILGQLEEAILSDYHRAKHDSSHGVVSGEAAGSGRPFTEQWALVTAFCHAHQFPVSCAYLNALAKDNNWVDFFAQAQIQGCSLEKLIPLALNFTDPNLRSHILIVLRSLPSSLPKAADAFLSEEGGSPDELFNLISKCEKSSNPAKALLEKARDLKWPLLPVVATCYDQVDPLLCLDVWLEIVAAAQESSPVPTPFPSPDGIDEVDNQQGGIRVSKKQTTAECQGQTTEEVDTSGKTSGTAIVSGPGKEQSAVQGNPAVSKLSVDHASLAKKVAMFCERQEFFPLLRGFELFSPASSLLPFIRFLQAFSQMRLSEASALLTSFSGLLGDELGKDRLSSSWITGAAISAADAMLDACPSPYERRCLLQLLSAADFGDGGPAALRFRRLYWKMQFAEPSLQEKNRAIEGGTNLEGDELLLALEKQGRWEDARSWARQLDLKVGHSRSSALHSVTESQAEAMVTDWKELLWDFPSERAALWGHCQSLFQKRSFPPRRAGMFFLKHANEIETEVPPSELHQVLLLAFEWLSDSRVNFPTDLLGELETRVWMLAVEAEAETVSTGRTSSREGQVAGKDKYQGRVVLSSTQKGPSPFEKTQGVMSSANTLLRKAKPEGVSEINVKGKQQRQVPSSADSSKSQRQVAPDRGGTEQPLTADTSMREAFGDWKKQVNDSDVERAILNLLEAGHLAAANQLQGTVSTVQSPIQLLILLAAESIALDERPIIADHLSPRVVEHLQVAKLVDDVTKLSKSQALHILTAACREGCGKSFCRRIAAVAQISDSLELPFSEAFHKQPTELLQLLTLRGQDALAEAELLVATHAMAAGSIARILAESFLKGLVAAHRGGYLNASQKEEGPAPLLWRLSDFEKWAQLCSSQQEVGHALMRLVISGQEMPLACEVELMILAHRFYEASACLDGLDVLVALASTRVELYVTKGAFVCLARLLTGIANFHTWRFILDLLIENGQLNLLLRMYTEAGLESAPSSRAFRLAVLSALKRFNAEDVDAFELVYSHFAMNHELADLKNTRAQKALDLWVSQDDLEQSEELLDVMRLFVEAGQLYASVDSGNQAKQCCALASLISLQLRMPEHLWLNLSETNARRLLVEQPRFEEALIVAEAYELNQPAEWVPVIWNHMLLYPNGFDHFLNDFVATLPLTHTMLQELTRFYRAEVAARGDQIDFSKWLTPAGVQLESSVAKAFRSLLSHVHDIRFRIQLAIMATGFPDIVDTCSRLLDKVPENAGPLILKRGHGGTYLPIM